MCRSSRVNTGETRMGRSYGIKSTANHFVSAPPFLTWSPASFSYYRVVLNVFQNDNVCVHADVKVIAPLENVGKCIYLIISSSFLSWFTFALDRMTSRKGRSLSRVLDLTDKSKRKSMIRSQRDNGGRIRGGYIYIDFLPKKIIMFYL